MNCSPFIPGDAAFINVPAFAEAPRTLKAECIQPRCFVVDIPARIGFSVKNMATFGPGKSGGGGIGMAVNLFSSSYVLVSAGTTSQRTIIRSKRKAVIEHHAEVFRACLRAAGWKGPPTFACFIVHQDRFPMHCGLGSTSGAALGALHGLNLCFGEPFSRDEIRLMLACNYVEESATHAGHVAYGYETTMTATGAHGGGCFVINEDSLAVLARNCRAFECAEGTSLPVLLFAPTGEDPASTVLQTAASGEALEADVLAEAAIKDTAAEEAAKKDRLFDAVLVPELARDELCDLRAVGAAVSELQRSGGKRVEVERQPHGRRILAFLEAAEALRASGAVHIAGMSSIGPAVAIVCRYEPVLANSRALRAELELVAGRHGLGLTHATSVNVTGLRAAEAPLPRLVHVLGRPCAGKTTLCAALAARGGDRAAHFAAGQHLRGLVAAGGGGTAAAAIADIMARGEVADRGHVTADVLLEELFARLAGRHFAGGGGAPHVLLDGFPRSTPQVRQLCSGELGLAPLLAGAVRVTAPDAARARWAGGRGGRAVGPSPVEEAPAEVREAMDATDAMAEALRALGVPLLEVDNDDDSDDGGTTGCPEGLAAAPPRAAARAAAVASEWLGLG